MCARTRACLHFEGFYIDAYLCRFQQNATHIHTRASARRASSHKNNNKNSNKNNIIKRQYKQQQKKTKQKDQKVTTPPSQPQHPASAKQQQHQQQQQQQQQQSKQTRPDTPTRKEPKGKRVKQSASDPNQPVCFRATLRPCNTVYLGDRSPDTMSPSATLKQGLLVNVAASPSTGVPTPGQPVADRPLFLRLLATFPLEYCKESLGLELCP